MDSHHVPFCTGSETSNGPGPKRNWMTILAKTMLEETPLVPRIVSHNDLLIQGIIFLLTFMLA